ncbi:Hypothetical protein PHPALM_3629 [Phytophthora palmivora]|uniref:Uncharacterized protein n=1 Tax=Phytophthora palmivora TaxID=4796 RepID=A0A2P4YLX4_9STRA|nr:Hypothetical protein PHPALM_3629 [Phytophthora palmivora]
MDLYEENMLSFWDNYATTNNPVEQYHRTLKLENSSHASAKKSKFAGKTEVSKRLKAHNNRIKREGQLEARALLPIGGHELVAVKHKVPLQRVGSTGIAHDTQLTHTVAGAPRTDIDRQRTKKIPNKNKNTKKYEFYADDVSQRI